MTFIKIIAQGDVYEIDHTRAPLLLRHMGRTGEDPAILRAQRSLALKQHRPLPIIPRKPRVKPRRARGNGYFQLHSPVKLLQSAMVRIHRLITVP